MKHFYGRITYDCNQTPVKNAHLIIYRIYDTGSINGATIGECNTDFKGYYSLMLEVELTGKLDYYTLEIEASSPFLGIQNHCENHIESSEIEINCTLAPRKAYSFHIANTSPQDNSDVFNSLIISYPDSSPNDEVVISNLAGMNVDTIIFINRYHDPFTFKAAFTKNGLYNEILFDSIEAPICLDTMQTDILY